MNQQISERVLGKAATALPRLAGCRYMGESTLLESIAVQLCCATCPVDQAGIEARQIVNWLRSQDALVYSEQWGYTWVSIDFDKLEG